MRHFSIGVCILGTFCLFPNISLGFLDSVGSLDMYKKIDKGVYDLELNYIERELKGGDMNTSIVENLQNLDNFYNVKNCFDTEFSSAEIADIANDIGGEILFEKLQNCVTDEGAMSISDFNQYQKLISNYYRESVSKAQNKTANLQKIASIGMYSDGVEENSPFDLLIDIENINRIIFEEELTYDGYNNFDIGKYLDDSFEGLNIRRPDAYNFGFSSQNTSFPTSPFSSSSSNPTQGPLRPIDVTDGNIFACHINESGLSQDTINALTQKSPLGQERNDDDNDESNNNSGESNNSGSSSSGNDGENFWNYAGNYSPVNDNEFWPCSSFFCISIDVISYRQNVLKGRNTIAIESLIKRSNDHIGKFAYTSLIPSVMTTNNFELGFQGLNLADIFHVGLQITTKPVPFLNLDKNNAREGRDETEYASKNLLTRYYANIGLDYNRANDLSIFTGEENTLKSVLDNTQLQFTNTTQAQKELQNYQANIARQNEFVTHSIDKKIMNDDTQEFQTKFTELQKFSQSLLEYSKNLQALAKKLNEKPRK